MNDIPRSEAGSAQSGETRREHRQASLAKLSLGAIRDFRLGRHVRLGVGGLYAFNFVPAPLEGSYAGDPDGAMLFVRLRID